MFKRMLVLITFLAVLVIAGAGATPGQAEGDGPLKGDITSLYRVADISVGATGSIPEDLAVYNGELYFAANGNDGVGRELWKYVPGAGASRVADIYLGANSSMPYYMTVYGSALYFAADGGDGVGRELWNYTAGGVPGLVTNIFPGATGSTPEYLAVHDGVLYFSANGGDGAGRELWSYDTTHGAQRVANIYAGAGSSSPSYMASYDGSLYFAADGGDGAGVELWKYDPLNGASRVEDINSGGSSFPYYLAVYSGALYFRADDGGGLGSELWMYDPVNGVQIVADINPGAGGSGPSHLSTYNGALYFSAIGVDGTGQELWKYDLVHGADRVADIYPGVGSSSPSYLAVYNGSLYFTANGNDGVGAELWQYGNTSMLTFRSVGSLDGWVLESGETTNVGGSLNATYGVFQLGDNFQDRQYRSILSFNTSILPDNAVVTGIILSVRRQSIVGTNPFTTHGNIKVDIRKGVFNTSSALQLADFQAAVSRANIGTIQNMPDINNWYATKLLTGANAYINCTGLTQLRLRFFTDDNNDNGLDIIKFYSGNNSLLANRPRLIVIYYVP